MDTMNYNQELELASVTLVDGLSVEVEKSQHAMGVE